MRMQTKHVLADLEVGRFSGPSSLRIELMHIGGLGHADGDAIARDDNFAARDGMVVCKNPHFIMFARIELDHSAATHAQQLMHWQGAAPQKHGDLDLDRRDLILRHRLDLIDGRSELSRMDEQSVNPSQRACVGWAASRGRVGYEAAVAAMEARAAAIADGAAGELVWLVEHPPIYTAGTSARIADLLSPDRFPVYRSGRGGQFTYHGPGQRVAYVMLDLTRRGRDVREFVTALETWIQRTLARFNVTGETRRDRVGVWVVRRRPGEPAREDKIAAIGVRLRRWVSFHGVALNVEPDLEHFSGIVPCGVNAHGVTSLVDLGLPVTMDDADAALRAAFEEVFGPTCPAAAPL
jgi:lipoyl(octanoyl) transferase